MSQVKQTEMVVSCAMWQNWHFLDVSGQETLCNLNAKQVTMRVPLLAVRSNPQVILCPTCLNHPNRKRL